MTHTRLPPRVSCSYPAYIGATGREWHGSTGEEAAASLAPALVASREGGMKKAGNKHGSRQRTRGQHKRGSMLPRTVLSALDMVADKPERRTARFAGLRWRTSGRLGWHFPHVAACHSRMLLPPSCHNPLSSLPWPSCPPVPLLFLFCCLHLPPPPCATLYYFSILLLLLPLCPA